MGFPILSLLAPLGKIGPMDLSADAPMLLAQLNTIVAAEPPPPVIQAVCFGLFEQAVPGKEKPVTTLYISGSPVSTDDPDWACWDEDSWLPKNRYFSLPELSKKDPSDWEEIQDAVADVLRANETEISSALGTPDGRWIAVGWDDGDPELLFAAKS